MKYIRNNYSKEIIISSIIYKTERDSNIRNIPVILLLCISISQIWVNILESQQSWSIHLPTHLRYQYSIMKGLMLAVYLSTSTYCLL